MITIEHVYYQIHDEVRKTEKVYNIVANKDKINGKFINTIYVNVTVKHNRRSISLNKQIWISKMSNVVFSKGHESLISSQYVPSQAFGFKAVEKAWGNHKS